MQDATPSIAIRKAIPARPSASQKSLIWKTLVWTSVVRPRCRTLQRVYGAPAVDQHGVVCLFEAPGSAVMAVKRKRLWVSRPP